MATAPAEVEAQKQAAAERAVELVKPGSVVGLGTGSTARYFIEGLARMVRSGFNVRAVATSGDHRARRGSTASRIEERTAGAPHGPVGAADETGAAVTCLGGRGGFFLREKV